VTHAAQVCVLQCASVADLDVAYLWTTRLVGVYALLDSLEKLAIRREFTDDGAFSWAHIRDARVFASALPVLDRLFAFRPWVRCLGVRAVCAASLLVLDGTPLTLSLAVLVGLGMLVNLRHFPFGAETQNRMGLMILIVLLIHAVARGPRTATAGLWFIAAQACFSYLTAGLSKLLRREWRDGRAPAAILGSPAALGCGRLGLLLRRHPLAARFLGWTTIGVECTFPLALSGQPLLAVYLAWGLLFHLAIAVVLRLNLFMWVWWATYPAIIFTAR